MRITKSLSIRKIGDEYLALETSNDNTVDFTNAFSMNETAFFLLDSFKNKDFTEDDLVNILLNNYDVTEDIARQDVRSIVENLSSAGVIIK